MRKTYEKDLMYDWEKPEVLKRIIEFILFIAKRVLIDLLVVVILLVVSVIGKIFRKVFKKAPSKDFFKDYLNRARTDFDK